MPIKQFKSDPVTQSYEAPNYVSIIIIIIIIISAAISRDKLPLYKLMLTS